MSLSTLSQRHVYEHEWHNEKIKERSATGADSVSLLFQNIAKLFLPDARWQKLKSNITSSGFVSCCPIGTLLAGHYPFCGHCILTAVQYTKAKTTSKQKTHSNPQQGGDGKGKLVGCPLAIQGSRSVVGRVYWIGPDWAYRAIILKHHNQFKDIKQHLKALKTHSHSNVTVNYVVHYEPTFFSLHNFIHLTFSPTCNEPAEIEEVHHTQEGWAQDVWTSLLPCACQVGQNQRENAGHPQHNQVDGNVGLHWTFVQMCSS